MIIYIVAIAFAFLAVTCASYLLFSFADPYRLRVRNRVEEVRGQTPSLSTETPTSTTGATNGIFHRLQEMIPHRAANKSHLAKKLGQAGIYRPTAVSSYYASQLFLAILSGAIALLCCTMTSVSPRMVFLLTFIAAALGSFIPGLRLKLAIRRRKAELQKSLPDFLDLVTVCLEGGLSLQETIRRVADELTLANPLLASELTIVRRDVELGATVDHALKRFATRSDYEGIKSLSIFIREAQRFGTNIAEALRSHADMLRVKREQLAEENSQKASVKILLPTLLLIFPAIFVVIVAPAVIQIQELFAGQ